MVGFTAVELREMMDKKKNIRNVSVIAHVNHGMSAYRCFDYVLRSSIACPYFMFFFNNCCLLWVGVIFYCAA